MISLLKERFKLFQESYKKHSKEIQEKQNNVNLFRLLFIFTISIVIEVILLLSFDIPNIINNGLMGEYGVIYLSIHLFIILTSSLGIYYAVRSLKNKYTRTEKFRRITIYVTTIIFIGSMAIITGLDQQYSSSIVNYILYILVFSAILIEHPKYSIIIYIPSHVIFILSMILFQHDPVLLTQNLFNGTIAAVSGYVVSTMMYINFFNLAKNEIKLKILNKKLEEQSFTDPLTETYNRRYGMLYLKRELERAKRHNLPLSVMMIDIDEFKTINDTYGHSVGDRYLQDIVIEIERKIRINDILVRYGGDEFILILPGTSTLGLHAVAGKLLDAVNEMPLDFGEKHTGTTISIGAACFPNDDIFDVNGLINLIDKRLYKSKAKGKNNYTIT